MAKQEKMLKVTWVKSCIGYNAKQALIIEALGFKKLNQTRMLPDNAVSYTHLTLPTKLEV